MCVCVCPFMVVIFTFSPESLIQTVLALFYCMSFVKNISTTSSEQNQQPKHMMTTAFYCSVNKRWLDFVVWSVTDNFKLAKCSWKNPHDCQKLVYSSNYCDHLYSKFEWSENTVQVCFLTSALILITNLDFYLISSALIPALTTNIRKGHICEMQLWWNVLNSILKNEPRQGSKPG